MNEKRRNAEKTCSEWKKSKAIRNDDSHSFIIILFGFEGQKALEPATHQRQTKCLRKFRVTLTQCAIIYFPMLPLYCCCWLVNGEAGVCVVSTQTHKVWCNVQRNILSVGTYDTNKSNSHNLRQHRCKSLRRSLVFHQLRLSPHLFLCHPFYFLANNIVAHSTLLACDAHNCILINAAGWFVFWNNACDCVTCTAAPENMHALKT